MAFWLFNQERNSWVAGSGNVGKSVDYHSGLLYSEDTKREGHPKWVSLVFLPYSVAPPSSFCFEKKKLPSRRLAGEHLRILNGFVGYPGISID